MATRFLLDSDFLIWILRRHAPSRGLFRSLAIEPLACSTMTVFEIWYGVRQNEREVVRHFLDELEHVPVTAEIAYQAAEYRRVYRGRGTMLSELDSLIATTSRVHRLTLVTYNCRDFPMDDIALYDPMPVFL